MSDFIDPTLAVQVMCAWDAGIRVRQADDKLIVRYERPTSAAAHDYCNLGVFQDQKHALDYVLSVYKEMRKP